MTAGGCKTRHSCRDYAPGFFSFFFFCFFFLESEERSAELHFLAAPFESLVKPFVINRVMLYNCLQIPYKSVNLSFK